jgi:hypothetical protein
MASQTRPPGTQGNSSKKPMSDMDPEGMDSDLEGEGDLDAGAEKTAADLRRGQPAPQARTTDSQNKANQNRSRRADSSAETDEGDEDEEDQDMEPRSTPRPASNQPAHNRRESDRQRPSPSGDRRR